MWDLSGPGLKPVTPALAGGFLTTAPPGKPPPVIFKGFDIKVSPLLKVPFSFYQGGISCGVKLLPEASLTQGIRE